MPLLLQGLALLGGLVLLAWWFSRAEPRQILLVIKIVLGILAAVVVAAVLWTGRFALASLLPFLAVLAWRALPAILARRRASGGTGGAPRRSEVRTAFLAMTLDHSTGETEGEVLAGRFAGRKLASLSRDEAAALQAEVAGDPQSATLLEAWIDRAHPEWRAGDGPGDDAGAEQDASAGRGADRPAGAMTEAEALAILGLEAGAQAEEIKAAHRRLMQKLHPDRGGSNWMAAKLNEAKDRLLRDAR